MCELFAMSARERATVNISLAELAAHGGRSAPHKDGWGIAFYEENDVRILRDTTCASSSPWVEFVAEQEIRSRLVMSHIRKATQGPVSIKNTQPFSRELGGRMHVFAHNGHIPDMAGLDAFAIDTFRPIGDTDSEYAFCVLLERLRPLWRDSRSIPDLTVRLKAVCEFAGDIRRIGLANFLYCDGEFLFAHGHRRKQADGEFKAPGLYRLRRQCRQTGPLHDGAVSVMSGDQDVFLVASVPLTEEAWEPFDDGEVVVMGSGREQAAPCPAMLQVRSDGATAFSTRSRGRVR